VCSVYTLRKVKLFVVLNDPKTKDETICEAQACCLVGTEFTTKPQPKRQQTSRHFPFEDHGCAEDAGGSAAGKNRGLQCAQSYKILGNDVSKHKRAIKTLEDFVEMERKTESMLSWMSPLELLLA
jgi:hypothetical protein